MSYLEDLKLLVKEMLKDDKSGHDYAHVLRVLENAKKIAINEEVDSEVLEIAALLHDIAFSKGILEGAHGDISAEIAKEIIGKTNISEEKRKKILQAVKFHDLYHRAGKEPTESIYLETKIIQEAGSLDSLGYIGVIRAVSYATKVKKDPVQIIKNQLGRLDNFNTKYGKEVAGARVKVMEDFLKGIEGEL